MSDLPERETRDALAEALYGILSPNISRGFPWATLSPTQRVYELGLATKLLAILPSVGLEIGRSKSA